MVIITKHSNGKTRQIYNLNKEGRMTGISQTFYSDGIPRFINMYKNGVHKGLSQITWVKNLGEIREILLRFNI